MSDSIEGAVQELEGESTPRDTLLAVLTDWQRRFGPACSRVHVFLDDGRRVTFNAEDIAEALDLVPQLSTNEEVAALRVEQAQLTDERDRYLKLNQALVQRDTPQESRTKFGLINRLTAEKEAAEAAIATLTSSVQSIIEEMKRYGAGEMNASADLADSASEYWASRLQQILTDDRTRT